MTREHTTDESDASTIDPRTRRARTEDMTVALRQSGGIYSVQGESGNTYRVDICEETCSCPDFQRSSVDRCKHLRRVDIELRNRTVPTPDGRLPEQPVADGGVDATQREKPAGDQRVVGPIPEFDRYGDPTGAEYYRCQACGREAMRERDLSECCPAAFR